MQVSEKNVVGSQVSVKNVAGIHAGGYEECGWE
jgi:hypothetical protein